MKFEIRFNIILRFINLEPEQVLVCEVPLQMVLKGGATSMMMTTSNGLWLAASLITSTLGTWKAETRVSKHAFTAAEIEMLPSKLGS